MKGAIETFVGVIIIALMVVLSTSYITASLNTRHAQNYHSAVISEIEASDHSDIVIQECINNAQSNGFALEVKKMGELDISEVTLTYRYTMPVLNSLLEHEIVGYAR